MNCIDEQLLQKYIDGECTETETSDVKQHLYHCSECAQRLDERRKLSVELKQSINSLVTVELEIPIFKIEKAKSRRSLKIIIYSLSAACIILFVLFFVDKKNDSNPTQTAILQIIPHEIDANRPASEQDFIIEVFDGKGGFSEYLIE